MIWISNDRTYFTYRGPSKSFQRLVFKSSLKEEHTHLQTYTRPTQRNKKHHQYPAPTLWASVFLMLFMKYIPKPVSFTHGLPGKIQK